MPDGPDSALCCLCAACNELDFPLNQPDPYVYKPDTFVALCVPRDQPVPSAPVSTLAHTTTIETATCTITIHYSDAAMLTVSPNGSRTVIFSGDLYRPQADHPGDAVLRLYDRRGIDFAEDLHGAFALLLVDTQAGEILSVTDRENSVKLLVQWAGESLVVSNSAYLQPTRGLAIDRAAVAAYLAAGFSYNDRTLYAGVHMLDGASVYRLRDGKLDQRPYWKFVFSPSGAPLETLKQELADRLIEAVRVRVRADRPTYLSLSAGEDARAILGALAKLGVPDVCCFTYTLNEAGQPDSDEALSAQLARMAGYSHRLVRSFDGDAVSVIRRNASMGGGMAQVCDEVDAWLTLGAQVEGKPMPVMFTGDTRFFRFDFEVRSAQDATFGSYMPDFTVLSWLRPLIGERHYGDFLDATRSDLAEAVRRVGPTDDGYELRDMLGFHHIHSRLTGTWREYYAGRWFRQARPLLDDDILDLFLRTPTPLRRNKRLYIATVSELFPQIFAVPRAASASYATYWPEAIRRQNAGLRALVEGRPSPLDDVIAPEILLDLLSSDLPSITRANSLLGAAVKSGYRALKRLNWRWMPFARPSLFRTAVPAQKFLTRALVLREFLADRAEQKPAARVENRFTG